MHLCMLLCLEFLLCIMLSFVISALLFVHVHGAVFPAVCGVRRVLFAGLRDGDVTVWHQSSWLQQWASMVQ